MHRGKNFFTLCRYKYNFICMLVAECSAHMRIFYYGMYSLWRTITHIHMRNAKNMSIDVDDSERASARTKAREQERNVNESKRIGKNTPVVRFKVVIRYRMRISHEYIQRTYARTHTPIHTARADVNVLCVWEREYVNSRELIYNTEFDCILAHTHAYKSTLFSLWIQHTGHVVEYLFHVALSLLLSPPCISTSIYLPLSPIPLSLSLLLSPSLSFFSAWLSGMPMYCVEAMAIIKLTEVFLFGIWNKSSSF